MMQTLRSAVQPVLLAIACAVIGGCADTPPKQTGMDYRSRPPGTAQGPNGGNGAQGQRLTIQSGEGERLNLPWFVRDTQDAINRN